MGLKQGGKWLAGCGLLIGAGMTAPAANAGHGFYLGLEGGANFLEPQDYDIYGYKGLFGVSDATRLANVKFGTGWVGGLTAGYAVRNGLRYELELDYRRNDFDHLYRSRLPLKAAVDTDDVGGFENADTAMANLWYDFFRHGRVHPYIGGGVGEARVAVRHGRYNATSLNNDYDLAFAYQGGAGIGFDLGKHLTASVDYRYIATNGLQQNLVNDQPTSHVEFNYRAHTAMFGLRYAFGGEHAPAPPPPEQPVQVVPVEPPPPAPPPPPPAPCAANNLAGCKAGDTLVLHGVSFEFNKATLTLNAKTLLDQVADALLARQDIKVEVDGHTDGIGAAAYNQKLSEKRAVAVMHYLAGRGVAADRMSAKGFGKSMPIADNNTEEGREQNRRVELKVTEAAAGAAPVESVPAGAEAPAPAAEAAPADAAPAADASAPADPAPAADGSAPH